MLELDINKVKNLDFEVQLSGIDHAQLEGWLRILIDGTEYGFKADVTPTNVIVNVPELKDMMLIAVTEMISREDIDFLVETLEEASRD